MSSLFLCGRLALVLGSIALPYFFWIALPGVLVPRVLVAVIFVSLFLCDSPHLLIALLVAGWLLILVHAFIRKA